MKNKNVVAYLCLSVLMAMVLSSCSLGVTYEDTSAPFEQSYPAETDEEIASASEEQSEYSTVEAKSSFKCCIITTDYDGSKFISERDICDEFGNIRSVISYSPNGNVNMYVELKYDSNYRKIVATAYNADGSIYYYVEYEYGVYDDPVRTIAYDSNGALFYQIDSEFDSDGKLVKSTSYSEDGSVMSWTEYEYDSAGNPVEEKAFIYDGYCLYLFEYEYNAEGNMITSTRKDSDGVVLAHSEYEYI